MMGWVRLTGALVCVALGSMVLVPLQVVSMKTGWFPQHVMRGLWHRLVIWGLGIRVHVHGAVSDKRPLLIASNHISWTDIGVFGSVHDVTFIAKADMAGWPFVGWLSTLQNTVYVEREKKNKSGEQANDIAAHMMAGETLLLFAEGTTGDGNVVLPFKSTLFGAATIALMAGAEKVYIQPAAIAYTRLHGLPLGRQHRPIVSWVGDQDLAPHAFDLLREGAFDVEVRFGEPIEFAPGSSRKTAAREIETQVRRMFVDAIGDPRP